jgi:hypothetical protein
MILYIVTSKRINDKYASTGQYIKNGKGRITGSDAVWYIDPFVFNLPMTQLL